MSGPLVAVSEYVKSLPKVTEGESIIPPKQLLMQIIDLLSFHAGTSEPGLFDFIKKYYYKK